MEYWSNIPFSGSPGWQLKTTEFEEFDLKMKSFEDTAEYDVVIINTKHGRGFRIKPSSSLPFMCVPVLTKEVAVQFLTAQSKSLNELALEWLKTNE